MGRPRTIPRSGDIVILTTGARRTGSQFFKRGTKAIVLYSHQLGASKYFSLYAPPSWAEGHKRKPNSEKDIWHWALLEDFKLSEADPHRNKGVYGFTRNRREYFLEA